MTTRTMSSGLGGVVRSATALATGAVPILAARWVLGRSGRVVGWVVVAVVAAALLHPVVDRLARSIGKALAVALTGLILVLALGAPLAVGAREIAADYERLREVAPEAAARLESDERFGPALTEFGLTDNVERFLDELPERVVGGSGPEVIRVAATRGVAAFITLVLSLFFVAYGPTIVHKLLWRIRDDQHRQLVGDGLSTAYARWTAYLWMMIGKAAVLGAAAYVTCRLAGLPTPMLLSVVVGVSSLLPTLGVVIGSAPAVLLALGADPDALTFAVALVLVIAAQVADWIVTTRLIEPRSLRAGTAVILVASLAGTWLFGLGGGLVGVAVAVWTVAVLDVMSLPSFTDPLGHRRTAPAGGD